MVCGRRGDSVARKKHFMNACKYLSALPVVFSGALVGYYTAQRNFYQSDKNTKRDMKLINNDQDDEFIMTMSVLLWVFSSLVNTVFSLYWDIVVDWSLGFLYPRSYHYLGRKSSDPNLLFDKQMKTTANSDTRRAVYEKIRSSQETLPIVSPDLSTPPPISTPSGYVYPFLRPNLYWSTSPHYYYFAILFDTLLRFAWVWKLSPTFALIDFAIWKSGTNSSITNSAPTVSLDSVLKVFEVLRRLVWCVFRIEREWVSNPVSSFVSPITHEMDERGGKEFERQRDVKQVSANVATGLGMSMRKVQGKRKGEWDGSGFGSEVEVRVDGDGDGGR